jgi:formate/nitrite transporter FocA (FNT family)
MAEREARARRKDEPYEGSELDAKDRREIRRRQSLRSPVIYEVVRREGDEELTRPVASLWWSGVAAGFGISLSLIMQGALHAGLPDVSWRPLLTSLGYTTGFVIVILGRLQLFTENTITAVLPLLADRSLTVLRQTLRLWIVVFVANMAGTAAVAALALGSAGLPPTVVEGMLEVSRHLLELSFLQALGYGVPAGFLVAAIVWMLPNASGNALGVIVLMTYAIALCGFTHVVAGSLDVWLLLFHGEVGFVRALVGMLLPVFVGNLVGGTGLFSLIAWGQVREELEPPQDER